MEGIYISNACLLSSRRHPRKVGFAASSQLDKTAKTDFSFQKPGHSSYAFEELPKVPKFCFLMNWSVLEMLEKEKTKILSLQRGSYSSKNPNNLFWPFWNSVAISNWPSVQRTSPGCDKVPDHNGQKFGGNVSKHDFFWGWTVCILLDILLWWKETNNLGSTLPSHAALASSRPQTVPATYRAVIV